jgi:hypothetical protein
MRYVMHEGQLLPWPQVAARRRERAVIAAMKRTGLDVVEWCDEAVEELARAAISAADGVHSDLPAPSIIRDSLDNVKNPVDGKAYDSKSAYYAAVKAAGCEIVGNEAEKMVGNPAPRSDVGREEVREALAKVKQGYKPAPLEPATKDELEVAGIDHD